MAQEVLRYIMTAPYTFMSGVTLLSELLPLPLPIQTRDVRFFIFFNLYMYAPAVAAVFIGALTRCYYLLYYACYKIAGAVYV